MFITAEDLYRAKRVLSGVIVPTPLQYSKTFSEMSGNEVYLKPENLQKTGAFKIRGAYNCIANLSDEQRSKGVVTTSAGNHAQGVAYAAKMVGVPATIVMPEKYSKMKRVATEGYGATVIPHGKNSMEMFAKANELMEEYGYTMVHPFDDPYIIAGQGTIGLEILEEMPDVEAVVVQCSGGGLISGIAAAIKLLKPTVRVIGVNAEQSPTMTVSLAAGQPTAAPAKSIADGLGAGMPGASNFEYCKTFVDEWVLVSEKEIATSMRLLGERAKLVVEGAGAAALAAVIHNKTSLKGKKVAVIVSGGNVDFELLTKVYTDTLDV